MTTLDDFETIKTSYGPLYIYDKVVEIPTCGCLVDPTSLVNVIMEDNILLKSLQRDFYYKLDI